MNRAQGGGASRSTDPASGTSAATDVSLREYITAIANADRFNVRMLGVALLSAGGFAWSQIQRRLEILNHENERLLAQQALTVSQDTYTANEEQRKKESDALGAWRKEVDHDRTHSVSRDEFQRDTTSERRGSIDTTTKVIAAVVGVLALVGTTILVFLAVMNYQALHHDAAPTQTVTSTTP